MRPTIRSGLSIALGIVAASCALAVLLQDAIRTGVWTLEHALIPGMVFIAIAAGHLATLAMRSRHFGAAAGFAAAFGLAAVLTLYTSVSRQADLKTAHQLTVEAGQAHRAAKETELTRLRSDLVTANQQQTREMTGQRCLDRCLAWKARAGEIEHKIARTEAELIMLGPPLASQAGADHVGALLALVGFGPDAKQALILLEPFLRAWLFELTAIVAVGFGFAPRATVAPIPSSVETIPEPVNPVQAPEPVAIVAPAVETIEPTPKPRGGLTRELAEQDLVTLLAMGRSIRSQDELAKRWNVPNCTVSRWLADFQRRKIVECRKVGRTKEIVAA